MLRFALLCGTLALLTMPAATYVAYDLARGQLKADMKSWVYPHLPGVYEKNVLPGPGFAAWFSGRFQKDFDAYWKDTFGMRGHLIRFSNQIYFTVFSKSYMHNQNIIVGRNSQLFERGYIDDYAFGGNIMNEKEMDSLADDMRLVQDLFKRKGVPFMILVTPSKAEFHPEDIPWQFSSRRRVSSNYTMMLPRLSARKVSFFDAHDILLRNRKADGMSGFARDGTHWNELGIFRIMNPLLEYIGTLARKPTARVRCLSMKMARPVKWHDVECDLLDLLNLMAAEYSYPVPRMEFTNERSDRQLLDVALVGGSFGESLSEMLARKDVSAMKKLSYYYYFKIHREDFPSRKRAAVDVRALDWEKEFLTRDVVVLELNKINFRGRHISLFLEEAKKNLR